MCEELHDPFQDQVACARFKAERDALAQAVQAVCERMEAHFLGVEGMEESPVASWARDLRAALGALHAVKPADRKGEAMTEYVVELTKKQMTDLRKVRRERVVRCRDCKHAIMSYQDGHPRCAGPMVMEATLVDPDGFCAWGEERGA